MWDETWWDILSQMTFQCCHPPTVGHAWMRYNKNTWQLKVLLTICTGNGQIIWALLEGNPSTHSLLDHMCERQLWTTCVQLTHFLFFQVVCCNEIHMEDSGHSQPVMCWDTPIRKLISITHFLLVIEWNNTAKQVCSSTTYGLFSMIWDVNENKRSVLSLTDCFSSHYLAKQWWYNSHTSC